MARPRDFYIGKVEALRAAWGGRCVWCGIQAIPGNPLEFAHLPGKITKLNGRGRGYAARYHDIRRSPGSYVLLCRDHHTELDGRGGRRAAGEVG